MTHLTEAVGDRVAVPQGGQDRGAEGSVVSRSPELTRVLTLDMLPSRAHHHPDSEQQDI